MAASALCNCLEPWPGSGHVRNTRLHIPRKNSGPLKWLGVGVTSVLHLGSLPHIGTSDGRTTIKRGSPNLWNRIGLSMCLCKNKNKHVFKMQHNTSKIFLRNILSLCPFVLLSFCPCVLLSTIWYILYIVHYTLYTIHWRTLA